jgi:hypothetical protein
VVDPSRRRRRCIVHDVELRVRALLRSQVVELTKRIALPFPPFPWLVLDEGDDDAGVTVKEVTWSAAAGRFVCLLLDDVDAAVVFGDDREGLKKSYEGRGWQVRDEVPVRSVLLFTQPA